MRFLQPSSSLYRPLTLNSITSEKPYIFALKPCPIYPYTWGFERGQKPITSQCHGLQQMPLLGCLKLACSWPQIAHVLKQSRVSMTIAKATTLWTLQSTTTMVPLCSGAPWLWLSCAHGLEWFGPGQGHDGLVWSPFAHIIHLFVAQVYSYVHHVIFASSTHQVSYILVVFHLDICICSLRASFLEIKVNTAKTM